MEGEARERKKDKIVCFLIYVESRFNYINVYLYTVIYSKKKTSLSDDLLSIAQNQYAHIVSFLEWP